MALSIFESAFGRERTKPAPESSRRRWNRQTGGYGSAKQEEFNETAARTLSAVQTICDTLVPPSKGRYAVVFGTKTAMTEFDKRRITITAQPLYMKGLRLADVADTFTGFVVHEIGHVEISQHTDEAIRAWLDAEPGFRRWASTIQRIANVLDDDALERWARARFPGVGHTFRVTTKFVAQDEGLPNKPPRRWDPKGDYATRFNFAVLSVRYRWFVRWVADPATRAERQWWIDWADTYANPYDAATRLEGIKAALARIAIRPEDRQPEPEPEPTEQGGESEPEQGDDEQEPKPGEQDDDEEPETFDTGDDDDDDDDDAPTSGGNNDDDNDDDEFEDDDDADGDDADGDDDDWDDEDEDGESEDEGDEDGDEGDEPEPGSEPGDDGDDDEDGFEPGLSADPEDADDEGDEPGEDESEGTDERGESEQWGDESDAEGDESEDERDEPDRDDDERDEGATLDPMDEGDLGQQGEGGSNPPIYDSFEQESLPARETIKTVDDYVEEREQRDQYRDNSLMDEVKVEMQAQKVTDTHGFGSMKVVISL